MGDARDPVGRALGAVALGVGDVAIEREAIARAKVLHALTDGEPHFALHDEGAYGEGMGVGVDHGARFPGALEDFVAADRALLGGDGAYDTRWWGAESRGGNERIGRCPMSSASL